MPKFVKKPIVIEAVQIKGSGSMVATEDLMNFIARSKREIEIGDNCLFIKTLEGVMTAKAGDWIIKGIQGEYYPCKPDVFAETYDKVVI